MNNREELNIMVSDLENARYSIRSAETKLSNLGEHLRGYIGRVSNLEWAIDKMTEETMKNIRAEVDEYIKMCNEIKEFIDAYKFD